MSARVGSDLEAVCGKCGEVWHVVIAVVDRAIAQVECKQCGARHRYRPVAGESAARVRAPVRRTAGARRRTATSGPRVEADPSRPPRPFQVSETYRVGDRVVHPSFGQGVVQAITGPTKIEVWFDAGPKTMVHGRGGG